MRGATACAQRLKVLFSSLRSRLGKVTLPARGNPTAQMILGILSRDVPESKVREALDRLRAVVVDYNELRVIPPIELAEMLGDYPDSRLKCEDISRALNKVFALTHGVSLEHLAELSRKEARAFLENVDGLEPYTRARIQLLGLMQHAIPLDEAMWAYARQEEIVDRRCPLEQAQGFLERQIAEEDALEFVALLKRQAWNDLGAAVRRGEVEPVRSVPPDRTSRNMLQMIGAASAESDLEGEEAVELADDSAGTPAARPSKTRRTPAAAKPRVRSRRTAAKAVRVGDGGRQKSSKAQTRRRPAARRAVAKSSRRARAGNAARSRHPRSRRASRR